jgi:ribosome maturation factor RimP
VPDEHAIKSTLEALAEPICRAHGVELVDIRHVRQKGGAVVRVVIDRERDDVMVDPASPPGSGVSVDDCQAVSRDLSAALDVHEELIPGRYDLEVSSPGIERPLVKESDFERFAGREAKVQTRQRVGERRRFRGLLRGIEDGCVKIEESGGTVAIPYEEVAKAHLVYRF